MSHRVLDGGGILERILSPDQQETGTCHDTGDTKSWNPTRPSHFTLPGKQRLALL
jgi:hypothetical protein